jgi:hypothetical protein
MVLCTTVLFCYIELQRWTLVEGSVGLAGA